MTRAAILPTTGDPYVALLWFHFFEAVWQNEVDRLYFVLNSPVEPAVAEALLTIVKHNAKVKVLYSPEVVTHGDALKRTLPLVEEDAVMLIEDDGIIFRPGKVKECFDDIEKGGFDIVGSDRGSASFPLIKRGQEVFELTEGKNRDRFPHFWPNFFFARTERYLATDLHFDSKAWKQGEVIAELGNWEAPEDLVGDTFVWGSIQLMAKHPSVRYVDQYHCYVNDAEFKANNQHLWDGNAPWLHYGSVSTGTMGMLVTEKGIPLNNRLDINAPSRFVNGSLSYLFNDNNRQEYERRIAWWSLCYIVTKNLLEDVLPDYSREYADALQRVIAVSGISQQSLVDRMTLYRTLLKL